MSRDESTRDARILSIAAVAACLVAGSIAALPYHETADRAAEDTALVLEVATHDSGAFQVFRDEGTGHSEANSAVAALVPDGHPHTLRFPLPTARYVALRLDPINGSGTVTLTRARIVDRRDRTRLAIDLQDIKPLWDIADLQYEHGRLRVVSKAGGIDPQLELRFSPALDLRPSSRGSFVSYATLAARLTGAALLVLAVLHWVPAVRRAGRAGVGWLASRPTLAVLLTALAGTIISNAPVIFQGRSYVSPNFHGPSLLYEGVPKLPGYTDAELENPMGTDIGAMAWHHRPLSVLEHRAVFRDGEWPLWNRYDSAGVPLLGQGQSMIGNPVHLIPLLANGASWAWDCTYVLARWILMAAIGLVVLRLTQHLPAALLAAISAGFLGFFIYRLNHPAYFSVCYAPTILLAWTGLIRADASRQYALSAAALIAASWLEITSGTVKEAYLLLVSLHATGALLALLDDRPRARRWRCLAWAAGAGVVFLLLSTPLWLTFLDALHTGISAYEQPRAEQILPAWILGFFDEIFYRPFVRDELVWNPSANLLTLGGLAFLIATWRRTGPDRARLALALGAAPAALIAFGGIPPEWLVALPFVGNVVHVDNVFSCVLLVHVLVLAGFGFRAAAQRLREPEARGDLAVAALVALAPALSWLALQHTVHREPFGPDTVVNFLNWGDTLPVSGFVWGSLVFLYGALAVLALTTWRAARTGRWTAAQGLLAGTALAVLLWRHAQHRETNFDRYVFNPAMRMELDGVSPAIDYVRAHLPVPARVTGCGNNLAAGFNGVYGLEGLSGPDAIYSPHYRELSLAAGLNLVTGWAIRPAPANLPRERPVYDFLNTRFYLDRFNPPSFITPNLDLVLDRDLRVYESPTVWPRAFFTDRVARYRTAAEFAGLIHAGDRRPFAAMQAPLPPRVAALDAALAARAVVPARDYELTTNTTTFTISAPGPGLVALHEAWFANDFRARVNGEPAECLRVNHAFKGVFVPAAGEYRVSFEYRPRYFNLSLGLAALGLLLAAAAGAWAWRTGTAAPATCVAHPE